MVLSADCWVFLLSQQGACYESHTHTHTLLANGLVWSVLYVSSIYLIDTHPSVPLQGSMLQVKSKIHVHITYCDSMCVLIQQYHVGKRPLLSKPQAIPNVHTLNTNHITYTHRKFGRPKARDDLSSKPCIVQRWHTVSCSQP